MYLKIFLIFGIFLTMSIGGTAMAEPIMITVSTSMSDIEFDGRWTHTYEWKQSTLNDLRYDDGERIILRSAHQGDFVYFFVDNLTDRHLDKKSDKATICLDTQNDKTKIPDSNDYCFMTTLEGKSSFTLQGGSPLALNSYFNKIENHEDFIAIGSVSNEHDRYTDVPHPSFEFRIPTDLISRNNIYGIYVGVYDAHNQKVYSYPQNIQVKNSFNIPSPELWGEVISPDKTLPEFGLPIFSMILLMIITVLFTTRKKFLTVKI